MFAADDRLTGMFAVLVAMPAVLVVHGVHGPRAVTGVTGRRKPARPDLVLQGPRPSPAGPRPFCRNCRNPWLSLPGRR
jgi:hypothetical protein